MARVTASAPGQPHLLASFGSLALWRRATGLLRQWSGRRRSRIALSRLEERHLRDIGLDAVSAGAEAARPFWH